MHNIFTDSFQKAVPRAKKRTIDKTTSSTLTESAKHVYSYSCAMLPLNDEATSLMRYWAKKHIPEDALYINEDEGIEGYESTPHVTVKYGLHDTEPDTLIDLIQGIGSVPLQFGNVTKFDTNPNFDVIKVDIDGDKLRVINQIISDYMEHSDKFPEYKPHATIAYVKKGSCDHLVDNDFFDKLNDKIDVMDFASRTGETHPIYL
jgi:hypothetical protein